MQITREEKISGDLHTLLTKLLTKLHELNWIDVFQRIHVTYDIFYKENVAFDIIFGVKTGSLWCFCAAFSRDQ